MREHWGSRLGFILAIAGSAIGLGNIWKFPYMCGMNGGGAFVLIYVICVLLVGLPLFLAELTLGRAAQSSTVGAFCKYTPAKTVLADLSGWLLVLTGLTLIVLKSYGYGKYLAPGNLDYDGFVGEIGENGKEIFSGVCKSINAKPCIYSKIKADTLIDLLSDNAEPESKLLPVALVASDEPALSFSVALGLRSQGLKVEEYISGGSMIEAEEYADIKGITILLWVSGNTVMMKNLKSGERSETTVDKLLQNK